MAFVLTFAIGAAIFIPVVQNDLEDRVEDELADAGVDGVSASFSGQDGTLRCARPLDDPDAVSALAGGVHGVRVVDLDRTCASASPAASPEADADDVADTEPAATEPVATEAATTTTTSEAPPATEPAIDSIVDIVDGDPLFGELAGAVATAGLDGDDAFGGSGPFTLLAPTDAAFDAAFEEFGADALNALTSDPEVLRTLLLHHATDGAITSGDFVAGDLEMLDGTFVTVEPAAADGITFTSGGVASGVEDPATQLDIEASNGVVHAIDRLLIPDGLGFGVDDATTTTASLSGGKITLSGAVQNENQRIALVSAAEAELDPTNVIDTLSVDADATREQADVDRLAALISTMPANLVDGEATLAGTDLLLTGTSIDADAESSIGAVGGDIDATLDLSPRDAADDDSAAALQTELNDFVRQNPVLFEPNSATLSVEATAVVDQLAARAARLDGTAITIIGHTDSDGDPDTNQLLSELRAASVLDALVERGLDAGDLAFDGRGAGELITDDAGDEDKAASRRVEFTVEAVS